MRAKPNRKPLPPRQLKPDPNLLNELRQHFQFARVVGLDEVGRGALAGPLVVAAVELPVFIPGLADSKQISRVNREKLAKQVLSQAAQISLGSVSNKEIDQLGLTAAQELAYLRALKGVQADLFLTDFVRLPIPGKNLRAPKGESLFFPVAAASIVAKVYRDQLMRSYSLFHPEYSWQSNVGYGTSEHKTAIKNLGFTALHRQSFL